MLRVYLVSLASLQSSQEKNKCDFDLVYQVRSALFQDVKKYCSIVTVNGAFSAFPDISYHAVSAEALTGAGQLSS